VRSVEQLESQLARTREDLGRVAAQRDALVARDANRHWTETDSATGSGIRRKPNPKADGARFDRYAREGQIHAETDRLEAEVARLERAVLAATTERDRVRLTRDDIVGATHVRTSPGWHLVARVNAKTVSVQTPYSWTDKYPFAEVLETRAVPAAAP
jgi:hypothetical protein